MTLKPHRPPTWAELFGEKTREANQTIITPIQVNQEVKNKFLELFKTCPIMAHAPGRINLIGEHTDYNNGYVMPAAINKGIQFAIALSNSNNNSVVYSIKYKQYLTIDQNNPEKVETSLWQNYLLGVLYQLKVRGYCTNSFNCVFDGDLPTGAGISSSAAMECGFVLALNELFKLRLSPLEMIHIAQWAEHHFVGVKCGIMDQFTSIMGKENHVILLDCQLLKYNYYPLRLNEYCLLLCDTNVKHALASSEYNTRRQECEEGVSIIKAVYPSVESLRDVNSRMLISMMEFMPEKIFNRCKYVVDENERVLQATNDLKEGNLKSFGEKMYKTHDGLSKLYEVSCPELDFLVEFTRSYEGILGSRMMGGGFGGCTINIIHDTLVETFITQAKAAYKEKFNIELGCHLVSTGSGACILQNPS